MGLTIHSTVTARRALTDIQARRFVSAACAGVHDLTRGHEQGRVTGMGAINPDEFSFWAVQERTIAGRRASIDIPPLRGYGFVLYPGAECEPAVFGLCRYPSTVTLENGTKLRTRLTGWRLHTCCKTQYADIKGWDHFLACHRLVISAALVWKRLGCDVKIQDEGHYWPGRRVSVLRENLATYNRLIAGFGGALKDASEDTDRSVESPIFTHPRFEHLEAEAHNL
jgi:hypothetical protein